MRTPPTAFKANPPGLHSHSNLLEAKLRSASPKSQKLNPLERKISASTSKIFTMENEVKFVPAEVSRSTAREATVGNNKGKSSESSESEAKLEFDVQEPSENKPKVEMGETDILDMISTARSDGDNSKIDAEDINGTTNSDDESEIFVDASMILNDGENETREETYDVKEEEGINIVQQPSTTINANESESEISPGANIIVEENDHQPSSGGSIESYTILASESEISPGANIIVEENNDQPSSGGENTSIESDTQPVKLDDSAVHVVLEEGKTKSSEQELDEKIAEEIIPGPSEIFESPIAAVVQSADSISAATTTETRSPSDQIANVPSEIAEQIIDEGNTKSSEQELDEKIAEEIIPEISKDVESPIAAVVQSADSISAATTTETRSPPDQLAKVPSETAEQIQPPSEIAPPAPAPNTESNTSNSSVRENGQSGSSSPIGRTKPAVPATRPQRRETERMTSEISVAQAVEPEKEIPPYMLPRPLPESTAPMFMWRPNASLSEPPRKKKIVVKQVEEKPSFWARLTGKGSKKKGTEDKKTERRKSKRDTQTESVSRSESSSESDSEESDSESEDSDASSGRKSHGGKEKHHSRGRSEEVESGKKKEGADIARSKSDRGSSTKREEKGDKIVRKSRSAGHKKDARERRSRQSSEERERVDEREKNRSRNDERVERSKSDRSERKTKQEGHGRRSKSARSRGDDGKSRSHRSLDERESGEDITRTKPLKREPEGYQPLPRSETVLKDDGGKSTGAPPVTRTQTEKMPEKKPPAPPIVIVKRPMLETLIPADLILEDQQVQVPDQNLQDPVLLIMTSCFPEEDASLLHSILEGHEFDLEKSIAACRSYGFTENTSAIQTALAPRKPASIAIDTSVKLMRLNGNFPELAKDVLTGALFAHDGDVDKTEAYLLANGENMNFHKVAPSVIPLSPETRKGLVNNEEREEAHGNRSANRPAPWTEMQDDKGEEDLT